MSNLSRRDATGCTLVAACLCPPGELVEQALHLLVVGRSLVTNSDTVGAQDLVGGGQDDLLAHW